MSRQDLYSNKASWQGLSPMQSDDVSLFGNSPSPLAKNSFLRGPSYPMVRRLMGHQDSNSQDSGYGTSYADENRKLVSNASKRSPLTPGSSSMFSMETEFMDLSNVELSEKPSNLPQDFNKLIINPLISAAKFAEDTSPKGNSSSRPFHRRRLSFQRTDDTVVVPNSTVAHPGLVEKDSEGRFFRTPERPSKQKTNRNKKTSNIFDDEEASFLEASIAGHTFSATAETIMCAVQKSSTQPDLIGDFSRSFSLPLTRSRHQDLKTIAPATLAQLLKGDYSDTIDSFKILDCRYPYEFEGGHIEGAVNTYTEQQCMALLDPHLLPVQSSSNTRHILIFHCEFSMKRGPHMYRHLRKEDRQRNESLYPYLHYPEIYLLEGGYKKFFEQFSRMCIPVGYKEMLHPDHEEDLRHFRQKSKTRKCDSRQRSQYGRNLRKKKLAM